MDWLRRRDCYAATATSQCRSTQLDHSGLRLNDDAAGRLAQDRLVGGGTLLQWIRRCDRKRSEGTAFEGTCQSSEPLCGVHDIELSAVSAEDVRLIVIEIDQVDFGGSSTDSVDDDEPPMMRQSCERRRRGHPSDGVIDHIHATTAGEAA